MRTPPVVVGCLFAAACGGPPGPALGPDPDPEGPSDVLIEPLEACAEPIAGFTRLEPGDIISTGTPGGVGHGRKPELYMKAGDVFEVEISGVGRLANPVVDE